MIGMESATSTPPRISPPRSDTAPGRDSRSTPTAASAATPSATQSENRTGSRELPSSGIWLARSKRNVNLPSIRIAPMPIRITQKFDPAIALRRPSRADDGQRHGNQAHVRVHLVVRVEAVHPVGVAGAGAVGLADDQRRQQLRMPRPQHQVVPASARRRAGSGRAAPWTAPTAPPRSGRPRPPGSRPCPGRAARALRPRSVAA